MASEVVVDANVILRFLTDEPRQLADRAAALLESAEKQRLTLLVAPLTVAEVVYVLGSVYRWERREIANQLLEFLTASSLVCLEPAIVLQALLWYRDVPGVHFADAYIAALSQARGARILTFDQGIQRVPGIEIVDRPQPPRHGNGQN